MGRIKKTTENSLSNEEWRGLKRFLSNYGTYAVEKPVVVSDVASGMERELGYASVNGVYLNHMHKMVLALKPDEQKMFLSGIAVHEFMHKILSNFDELGNKINEYPRSQQRIFQYINNSIEDPAIEHFSPQYIVGLMQKSLRFAIKTTYEQCPNIETIDTPFGQFSIAIVQYGDRGLLKGHFTFPEAEKCFFESVSIINEAILEPMFVKRLELSAKVMEIAKPLWLEESIKNAEFEKLLEEMFKKIGKSLTESSSGKGKGSTPERDGETSKMGCKARKKMVKVCEEKSASSSSDASDSSDDKKSDDSKKSASSSSDASDSSDDKKSDDSKKSASSSSDTSDSSDDKKSDDSKKSASSSSDASDSSDDEWFGELDRDDTFGSIDDYKPEDDSESSSEGKSSKSDTSELGNPSSDNDKSSENSDSDSDSENNSGSDTHTSKTDTSRTSDEEVSGSASGDDDEIEDDEEEITEDDIENIINQIAECVKQIKDEEEDVESINNDALSGKDKSIDVDVDIPEYKGMTCRNQKVVLSCDVEALSKGYSEVKSELVSPIKIITNGFKRIFCEDIEERDYKTSGRIAPKRLMRGVVTSRLYSKIAEPSGKSDIAIMLLIDESGSMRGCGSSRIPKFQEAKKAAIVLSEVAENLQIPLSVIGFSADNGADATHYHYINWKNNRTERLKLLNISARSNNFDGYSIRYAHKLLKKRKEKHRLLVVMSDGEPACSVYCGSKGIIDTANAIKKAKKTVDVLGVGLGICKGDVPTYETMYGKDFLLISNPSDLAVGLCNKLRKIVKKWD